MTLLEHGDRFPEQLLSFFFVYTCIPASFLKSTCVSTDHVTNAVLPWGKDSVGPELRRPSFDKRRLHL